MQESIHQETLEIHLNGLSLKSLVCALCILCFSCILLGTKIFLTSEIYRSSRNINVLQAQYDILLEEKQRLEKELEVVRSRYLITNLDD
ncbi:hypothetical protein CQA57_05020 [Helicobacter anseris]|uniref:Septum formation initiator n=1 Tax=Helicobacter anseris TaxID=375926 RepID=A0A3D8J7Q5_9HELI|nr:hypothetical protein [Helicobacter anseris]RDU73543.1 hypothetical protein CQA57_05020 [Helicobacter anseris]